MATPTPIISELSLLQMDIKRKLDSEFFFIDIPVFAVRDRTIESEVAKAVMGTTTKQGKTGIAVQVLMPQASCPPTDDNVSGPFFTVSYIIRVQEIPMINMGAQGTGKSAEDVAVNILNMLHHFNFGRSLADFRASPNALVSSVETEPRVTYDVEFYSMYQLPGASTVRTPTPTAAIDPATSILTLACSDPTARIYWTDQLQCYPSAADGGQLYSTPFAVTQGQYIRAAAYTDALQGSDIVSFTVTP